MSTDDDGALHARVLAALIRQAQGGDRNAAMALIADFAELSKDPHCFDAVGGIPIALTQYIATCLADWRKRDFKDAETWFHVVRAANAPDQRTGQHLTAMRAYMLLRARAKGTEAARVGAAAHSGLTESQVKYLVDNDKPKQLAWFDRRQIGEVESAALLRISPRLHDRVLNPPRKIYQRSR